MGRSFVGRSFGFGDQRFVYTSPQEGGSLTDNPSDGPVRVFDAGAGCPPPHLAGCVLEGLETGSAEVRGRLEDAGGAGAEIAFGEPRTGEAALEALVGKCAERIRVLLVDEGRAMDPAVAQGFLSLAQSLSARSPFLLVMAGASRMKHMIKEADVSCRARAVKLPIGRLSEKESEDAAAKPFDAAGFAITPGALKAVVAEPQRHPLFIQDWETCFRQLKKSRDMKEIILDAVDRA